MDQETGPKSDAGTKAGGGSAAQTAAAAEPGMSSAAQTGAEASAGAPPRPETSIATSTATSTAADTPTRADARPAAEAGTGGQAVAAAKRGRTEPLTAVQAVPSPGPAGSAPAAAARPAAAGAAPRAEASAADADGAAETGTAGGRTTGAGFAADHRVRVWILRAVAGLAVFIAVTIWAGWRVGLTLAALPIIADIIYRSKTMTVTPAEAKATAAQKRTRRTLRTLRRAGYVSLHARAIPGSESVIDHLVIGPGGVVAIDSEYWDKRLLVRARAKGSAEHELYHGPFSQKARLAHARWEARQAAALLGAELGGRIEVRPAMAIYGPGIPWAVATLGGVDVFAGGRVAKYLRQRSRASRQARLSASQVEAIRAAASQVLPPI